MRITGGAARGISLKVPKGAAVRPATDRMREALFGHLGERVVGARVLDLFGGSGAYGLEAASRGAGSVLWVEKHGPTAGLLEANLRAVQGSCGGGQRFQGKVVRRDVLRFRTAARFSLILMDPPYALARERGAELVARAAEWLEDGTDARLVVELPGDVELGALPGLTVHRQLGSRKADAPAVWILARGD